MKKKLLKMYKYLTVPVWKVLARISQWLAAITHKQLMLAEWCVDNPEFFDHDIDLYYQWGKEGRAHWLERGIYNILALQMFEKPIVVELCCGEGFNTKYFYSKVAKKIWACDFEKDAIKGAKKKYLMDNIEFVVADIRKQIPLDLGGEYITNIIWDAAIEHFTPEEIHKIMSAIKMRLKKRNGILSGHTIVERSEGKSLEQHEYEFKDKEDLERFLTPYFENVVVFETIYDNRHNLYFWASDGVVPFHKNWEHGTYFSLK